MGGGGGTLESESLRGMSLELLLTLELSPVEASGCEPLSAPGRGLGGVGGAWLRARPGYYYRGFVEPLKSLPAARSEIILVLR